MHLSINAVRLAFALGICAAGGTGVSAQSDTSAPVQNAEQVIKLDPLTVSAVYPAIRVRFELSRQNLFDPLGDPVVEARVVWVESETEENAGSGIQAADVLLSVNGTELRGLTLRQIAVLVAEARKTKNLIWEIRRGFTTLVVRHNGRWDVPLPGLER
jgi:hypothetical protein